MTIDQFSSILIHQSATVKDALKQLDKNAQKILFVVKDDNKLVGSLTDGDIRRWILREGSLTAKAKEVCYKDTYFVWQGYNLEEVKNEIQRRKIFYVPVVDRGKKIQEFLVWDKLFVGKLIR